ncbi:hypothetical protein AMK59_498 [Oryctes borbonicus]|uniref:Uncharacterized protein n=1 Tax=Oryctes borbonicus TaxID=1629725 RepID=A0A0T6BD15_9SCAR|nr:hypothetical protein AMK59_498 [Oryctes borbonicus]
MFWRTRKRDANSKVNMSAICQNFVQNAWKKDLCSNCFKSRDEHNETKPKLAAVSLNRAVGGIIRNGEKTKPKRTVEFTKQLSEVIGYGGEDWSSDQEDEDSDDDPSPEEDGDLADADEDKELQKLTKANTDFNASSLQELNEVKKSYTQLMLGKPQLDSDGKKQTLLVSVTPFGQEPSTQRKYQKTVSHIPIAKNNKETLAETKNNHVILTSYTKNEKEEKSLLDEISETLENSKNPIQIISRKKIEKEVILTNNQPEIIAFNNKENIDCTKNKNEDIDTKNDKLETKLNKSNIPERKNGLTRTTPIVKRDQENKPVVYQTSVAKIELMNTKNLKLSSSKENLQNKSNSYKSLNSPSNIEKVPSKEDLVKDPIIKETILKEVSQTSLESSLDSSKDTSSGDESIISTSSSTDEASKHIEPIKETPKPIGKHKEAPVTALKLAPLPPVIPNSKVDSFSIPESREQAGEPDGRADPEENEPPALPLTPPPTLDGHTSFLHNKSINDKPKVPSKPSTIVLRKSPTSTPEPPVILTSFISDIKSSEVIKPKLEKTDSNGSDIYKSVGKRKAPQPPSTEDVGVYTRHPMHPEMSFGREKERKERASSCSPDLTNGINCNPTVNPTAVTPEPAPRRSLSLSTDSLSSGAPEEKKKEKRGRFSLKKFLRMGSSKDLPKTNNEVSKSEEPESIPQPKPRLVIVHPLELNGAKVEVVAKPVNSVDNVDYCNMMKQNVSPQGNYPQRASKPPPPQNLKNLRRFLSLNPD